MVSHSESHWSTVDTLLELIEFIDKYVAPGDLPRIPWVCVLDAAPTHLSKAFVEEVKKSFWWDHLVFVERHATAFSQPLDIAYMKPFKADLRKEASMILARQVLNNLDDECCLKSVPTMRVNFVGSVNLALSDLQHAHGHCLLCVCASAAQR